jgi:predicted DNA-binding protein (UPF0251 family)
MGVSRGTVQRLVSEARRKVATALVHKAALAITHREVQPEVSEGENQ